MAAQADPRSSRAQARYRNYQSSREELVDRADSLDGNSGIDRAHLGTNRCRDEGGIAPYPLFGAKLSRGYETARAHHVFNGFVDASAHISLTQQDILVRFEKRARIPLLRAARFGETAVAIPWLGDKRVRLQFG
jgi:hypothetical protein